MWELRKIYITTAKITPTQITRIMVKVTLAKVILAIQVQIL